MLVRGCPWPVIVPLPDSPDGQTVNQESILNGTQVVLLHNLSAALRSAGHLVNPPEPEMADSCRRTELVSEIRELTRQQMDCCTNAAFLGWTPESKAAHDKRADRIHVLSLQLDALGAQNRVNE